MSGLSFNSLSHRLFYIPYPYIYKADDFHSHYYMYIIRHCYKEHTTSFKPGTPKKKDIYPRYNLS